MSVTVTAPATFTTTVTSTAITLATASNTGTAKFNTANFAVSGAGDVTIKDAGVLLTAEVTGTLPAANGGTGLTAVTTLLNSNQAYSDISGTPTLGTVAALAVGISNTNVLQADANVSDDDFIRVAGTKVEGRTAAQTLADIGGQAALTFGKSSGNSIKSEAALDTNDFLRVGTTHVVGRTNAEVLSDIGAQASDADLTAIAGLTSAANKGIQFTGSGAAAVYDLTAAGKALLDDADAAAQRTTLGVTNIGSYTGQIETVADKTYTLDPGAATDRTITGFYIQSASGTVTATLKVGTAVVKAASVTDATTNQTSLANTSLSANGVLTLVCSSNSSALDVIFAVEYTE